MLAETRRLRIVDLLSRAENGVVTVVELSKLLGVSEMTIRRDLDWLESKTIVRRVHGGAVAFQEGEAGSIPLDKPFDDRLNEFNQQKQSIGWAAAQLVKEGDRIILDAGTTTQQVARNLACKHNLTVITNNLPVVIELSRCPDIQTIVLGGVLKHKEVCTIGGMIKQTLSFLAADKLFLSAAGFSLKNGVTDPDLREVEVKQAMIQAVNEVILVADSRKYNIAALVKIAPMHAVHKLVTDNALAPEALRMLEDEGVQVVTPERLAVQMLVNHPK